MGRRNTAEGPHAARGPPVGRLCLRRPVSALQNSAANRALTFRSRDITETAITVCKTYDELYLRPTGKLSLNLRKMRYYAE
jgi:hypothetical protein